MGPWVVEQRRGTAVEARHRVHACATGPDGQVLWQVGRDLQGTFRSAAKPFQLEAVLALLPPALRAGLTDVDLALGAASHHGEPGHLVELARLLAQLGCQRSQLYCGAHEPSSHEAARALWARGEAPDVLHNNCAGKHAFMAAACTAQGYDADYRPRDHPLQQAVAQRVEARTQAPVESVVDGCGVPCFVLPLSAMARSYAQIAKAVGTRDGSDLSRIGSALRDHPFLMSGSQAYDGFLNREAGLVAKVGALGLLCVALPELEIGIAIKVESGSELARPVAVHALLSHFHPGLVPVLPDGYVAVRNVVGARVGELACVASAG